MARVTITIDEDRDNGKVIMTVEPSAQSLKDRVKEHGWQSLSPAEGIAIGVVAHVLENAGPQTQASRSSLILPNNLVQ